MLYVRQLKLGPMDNFVYLVGAADSPETAIVDPAWDVPAALRAEKEDGRRVTHALLSHHHFDHVNGVPDLLGHGGIRALAHAADVPRLAPEVQGEVAKVSAGDAIEVGPLRIRAFHTPGHTPGSTCWQVDAEGTVGSPATYGPFLAAYQARRVLMAADPKRFGPAIGVAPLEGIAHRQDLRASAIQFAELPAQSRATA